MNITSIIDIWLFELYLLKAYVFHLGGKVASFDSRNSHIQIYIQKPKGNFTKVYCNNIQFFQINNKLL